MIEQRKFFLLRSLISQTRVSSISFVKSERFMIGKCSLKYRQNPPRGREAASLQSERKGVGEKPSITKSWGSVLSVRQLSQIPNKSKLWTDWRPSIRLIFARSRVSRLSIFQQQKEILLRTEGGPGLTWTEPDAIRSNWTTKEKKPNKSKKSLLERL